LRLQRTIGNRSVVSSLARQQRGRDRARCASSGASTGRCTDDALLEMNGTRLLRAAVEARSQTEPSDAGLTSADIAEATTAMASPQTTPAVATSSRCTTWCFTPLPLSGPAYVDAWGILAHAFISSDYESVQGVSRGVDVYFDDSLAGPIDFGYGRFIHRKNPTNIIAPVFFATTPVKRPDALLHDASRTEFEEFKPNNLFGKADGYRKLATINLYMGLLGLPYNIGTTYTPTASIPILTTSLRGIPIEFSLSVRRDGPGLIVYEYCICTDWELLAKGAVIALIIVLIAILLRGMRLPIPGPIPSPVPA
jgi:hypothetical protein